MPPVTAIHRVATGPKRPLCSGQWITDMATAIRGHCPGPGPRPLTLPLGQMPPSPPPGTRATLKRSRCCMKVWDPFFQHPRSNGFLGPSVAAGRRARPHGRAVPGPIADVGRRSPLQTKHWMWKYLLCTRSTSPLHTFPQVLHRIAVLAGFSGAPWAAWGSDTVGQRRCVRKWDMPGTSGQTSDCARTRGPRHLPAQPTGLRGTSGGQVMRDPDSGPVPHLCVPTSQRAADPPAALTWHDCGPQGPGELASPSAARDPGPLS